MDPLLGKTLGPYELLRMLGRGGMGEVYLARDPRLGRDVALKVLSDRVASSLDFQERFLREARSASSLSHPNITTVHEIGTEGGRNYISFEYVDGQSLESVLKEGPLGLEKIFAVGLPLADALVYAHRRGVVHRDLKPSNVMISEIGIPKILDFGLAKVLPPTEGVSVASTMARLTNAGTVLGTLGYMSPEQTLGKDIDGRSDVFSFGCLLYEMACGKPAFTGASAVEMVDNVLHQEPVPLSRLRPELPEELSQIVTKALRKAKGERYQHMPDLAADLRHVQRKSLGVSVFSAPHAGRFKRLALAGAAAVVIVGLGFSLRGLRRVVPEAAPGSLAVMYFENLADPGDANQTGRMLSRLLTTELSGSEGLTVLSQQRLYDLAKEMGRTEGVVDRSVATEVARRAGVSTMVLGQVARAGERMVVTTELVDVASGRSLASQKVEGTSVGDIFAMAEALSEEVRGDMRLGATSVASLPKAVADAGGPPTDSVEAYRAYIDGEELLNRGDYAGAQQQFREATQIDSGFGLAYYRLSIAARLASDEREAVLASERAERWLDRLPPDLKGVVRANAFYQKGNYHGAVPLLESVLDKDPEQKEALYLLSQICIHSTWGASPERAAALMERVLALDSGFYRVYDRLALAYALQGNFAQARTELSLWKETAPAAVESLSAVLALFEGRPDDALSVGQGFSWLQAPLVEAQAAMIAGRWDVARRIVSRDAEAFPEGSLRAWALRNRGELHVYRGEFAEAEKAYRAAGAVASGPPHEGVRSGVPASALQALSELLLAEGDPAAAKVEAERALGLSPESPRHLYFAGRFALAASDRKAAEAHLRKLEATQTVSGQAYRDALQAELKLADGKPDEARALLEPHVTARTVYLDWASTYASPGAAFRDALARAHLALGDKTRAVQVMTELLGSGVERLSHPALYVITLQRLARLRADLGDEARGRELERTFESHWKTPPKAAR